MSEPRIYNVGESLVSENAELRRQIREHEAALRDRDALMAERDRYRDALIAKHGGEPVALLAELDAARAERDDAQNEREALLETCDGYLNSLDRILAAVATSRRDNESTAEAVERLMQERDDADEVLRVENETLKAASEELSQMHMRAASWPGVEIENLKAEVKRLLGLLMDAAQFSGVWSLSDTISPEIAATFPQQIGDEVVRLKAEVEKLRAALAAKEKS